MDGNKGPFGVEVAPDAALCFFDVDGTLLWIDEHELATADFVDYGPNESVRAALRRLRERGHHAFLCTGRPLSFVPESVLSLGFTGCITGAGACISHGEEIVYESLIGRDLLLEVAERSLRLDTPVMFESRETTVIVSRTGASIPGFFSLPVAKNVDELRAIAPDLRFSKLCCTFKADAEDPKEVAAFRDFMRGYFLESDMGLAHEYSLLGVDKGSGMGRVLGMLGRDARNTYAFGDSENDLPMFSAAETSVAMGNAMDVLKEKATYVTGHAAEDGIERALVHFGLI